MFEAQHARNLIETLTTMVKELDVIAHQELDLQRQVNPSGAPTPISADAVAILSARVQLITLTKAVSTIGTTLVEILTDRAEEESLGL
jgi:hypothetical protein